MEVCKSRYGKVPEGGHDDFASGSARLFKSGVYNPLCIDSDSESMQIMHRPNTLTPLNASSSSFHPLDSPMSMVKSFARNTNRIDGIPVPYRC